MNGSSHVSFKHTEHTRRFLERQSFVYTGVHGTDILQSPQRISCIDKTRVPVTDFKEFPVKDKTRLLVTDIKEFPA